MRFFDECCPHRILISGAKNAFCILIILIKINTLIIIKLHDSRCIPRKTDIQCTLHYLRTYLSFYLWFDRYILDIKAYQYRTDRNLI